MTVVNTFLKKAFAQWKELLDEILTKDCGCIHTCRLFYIEPELIETCESYNNEEIAANGINDICKYQKPYEDIDIAVFTDPKKFIGVASGFNIADGMAQTIVSETNFIKLKQCRFAILDFVADSLINAKYEKMSEGSRIGFTDNYYYALFWKKC